MRRVRAERIRRGWSGSALGHWAGVSPSAISGIENGYELANVLQAVARVLDVEDPRSLLDFVHLQVQD
jgi:transcriptional regulator with XRE-family HTH domain